MAAPSRTVSEVSLESQKNTASVFQTVYHWYQSQLGQFRDKGFSPKEAKDLCQALEEASFDYVELSGGTYESLAFGHKRESTKMESFFIVFAEEIVKPLAKTKAYVRHQWSEDRWCHRQSS